MTHGNSLASGFFASAARFPDRIAVDVEGRRWSYAALHRAAGRLAAALIEHRPPPERSGFRAVPLGGVLASRSSVAYQGILATLMSGAGYVPLNPSFPVARRGAMARATELPTLIVDRHGLADLGDFLAELDHRVTVILPEEGDVEPLRREFRRHRFLGAEDLPADPLVAPVEVDPLDTAYVLFTSGSTGQPKGIPVTHANARHHVETMAERYGIVPEDRFSQMFDLTFDLSVFDLFVAWGRGSELVVVPPERVMGPAKLIRQKRLTCWFSVPSVAAMMRRLRMLKPGAFPTLRWSLFCGEPLPVEAAAAWAAAAAGSRVENLYGPTEATISCTGLVFEPNDAEGAEGGVVGIGTPLPGTRVAVVDARYDRVADGEPGELVLGGVQVTPGYWRDPKRTAQAFVPMPWDRTDPATNRWYRTGDLVRRDPENPAGNILFLGRVDHQVKIQGHRVELGEIEARVRQASGSDQAAAIPIAGKAGGYDAVVVFVAGRDLDTAAILVHCHATLPEYMVPRRVEILERMPLNVNGKIDRNALRREMESKDGEGRT